MRRLRDLSIQQKLTLIVMIPSFIALVIASGLFIAYDYFSFRQSMVTARLSDAEMIAANTVAALTFDDDAAAGETLKSLSTQDSIVAAFIFTTEGRVFARYLRPETAGERIIAEPRPPGAYYEDEYLYVCFPMMLDEEVVGTISIQSDLTEIDARVRRYAITVLPIVAIGFAVALSLQVRLRRVITQPISDLASTALMVSEKKDYSARARKYGEDEIGQLIDSFNEMLSQIQQQDAALREGEARFRNVLDNTRDLLYKLNLDSFEFEYFSPAAREVTGFTPEELFEIGFQGIRDRVHPEDQDKAGFAIAPEVPENELSTRVEYRWKNKYGRYIWASENRTAVRDGGRIVAVVGSFRDVTIAKRAQEDIARVRGELQNIIDSMPSILIGVDPQGNVTHWNLEAARVSGRDMKEAEGTPFYEAFPLLHDKKERILDTIREDSPYTEQFSVRMDDENVTHYDLIVYSLREGGVEGAVIRVDDVSTRVQIEELMVQTEKMMSVGGLAAGMAHEINNPLGGILQSAQNIVRRTSLDLPRNRQVAQEIGVELEKIHLYMEDRGILEFIQSIQTDGARAAKIVRDMLAFSRRSDTTSEPANVAEMIDTVLRLAANDYNLKKHYDFRRVSIVRDFDPNLPEVTCDKTKIEQVLLNLVKNAAQAMSENKQQTDPAITIRTRAEPEYARIEVLDNGPGMPEEVRRRVLEPFFTTKAVGVGTGLGLSVSYFIIARQHHGTMSVESEPGKGTRFIIRLPLNGATVRS